MTTVTISPDALISALNKTDYYIKLIFTRGACYKFYEFLKELFPNAEPYLRKSDKNHVVTKIDEKYYDITGEVTGEYLPLSEADIKECKTWLFSPKNMCEVCNERE